MVKANVVGPNGITLQARPRREDGSIDKLDASAIENAVITVDNKCCRRLRRTICNRLTTGPPPRLGKRPPD